MVSAARTSREARAPGAPDLSHFRRHYPLTVMNFGALADREAWLRRVWEADVRWQEAAARAGVGGGREAVVRGAPPAALSVEGEFDVIYAGGALGLLHAGVMACCYKRRVLVLDAQPAVQTGPGRNLSAEELRELEGAGLFTPEEVAGTILNRYRSGFVKFHDAGSRVKAPPLQVTDVADASIDAGRLLALAAAKLQGAAGCAAADDLRFRRAYVEPHRVTVEAEDGGGRRRLFAARLFVDAAGTGSAVARQLNEGRACTHVCPTVGTVARGFVRGEGADRVDFNVGELLVSKEDASEHRQLLWEGFGGDARRDEYATYLFFYDAADSRADKSLLALYEQYFERLPRYKRAGAQWKVTRPVFGHLPSFRHRGLAARRRTADDRVLVIGDAAGLARPPALNGFGGHVRNLRRVTQLTELALAGDLLDARALSEINAYEPRVAQTAGLAEFLRPTAGSAPAAVNETLNALMAALHDLDERVRRELFQERLSFSALRSLLGRTAQLYPRIFQRVREHLGARGTFWWLANVAEAAFSERRAGKTQRLQAPEGVGAENTAP